MSDSEEAIAQQQLLTTYRQTLAIYLQQAARQGGETYALPSVINGIREARANIRHIKAVLRSWKVMVEDLPDDEERLTESENLSTPTRWSSIVEPVIGQQTIQPPSLRLLPSLHQLPPPVADFVGRSTEIDRLVEALSSAAKNGAAAAITGIRGLGGIGKTELAYKVAQCLLQTFPDAQLFLALGGAGSDPLTPVQALQLLIHFVEPDAHVSYNLSELQGLYRSVFTGRKALILADDAQNPAQIRPLMPPPGNALLITSRQHFSLPGMVTADLQTLTTQEAIDLLLYICPRIGDAASHLAELCGYLPLALRVSASLLASNDTRSVTQYLEGLHNKRLESLVDPIDPEMSVKASLRISYDDLTPDAQNVLCELSVFGASFDLEAAKSVVESKTSVVSLLDLLHRQSLLEWDAVAERYNLHDLVREFSSEQAKYLVDQDTLWYRYAQYYAKVAYHADQLYKQRGASLLAGLALFDREHFHISAGWSWAQEHDGKPDTDMMLIDYADATANIGNLRYVLLQERERHFTAALAAARRQRRRDAEARILGYAGVACENLGNPFDAIDHYEQALNIVRELGNRLEERKFLVQLGGTSRMLGNTRRAIALYEQALEIACNEGDRHGQGIVWNSLGLAFHDLDDMRRAIEYFKQALDIAHELGYQSEEWQALDHLGSAYHRLGQIELAVDYYKRALSMAVEDQRDEGRICSNLAWAYAHLKKTQQAIEYYERAIAIARAIGDRAREAWNCWELGGLLTKIGNLARAVELKQVLVDYMREIDHPETDIALASLDFLKHRLQTRGA